MKDNFLSRLGAFAFGAVAYCAFLGTLLYAIGFLENLLVPKSIDSGTAVNVGFAIATNSLLLAMFALQHSIMARPAFKRWWTRLIPKAVERSAYVLLSSLALALLFIFWKPLPMVVWRIENSYAAGMVHLLCAAGWIIVVASTFLINHFDLFGLRQVFLHLVGKAYRPLPFRTAGFYRYVRHPLMAGFLIAFWATPEMSLGRLLFAVMTTLYILAAIQLEERDLERHHGEIYAIYRRRVPMLLPVRGGSGGNLESVDADTQLASTEQS